MGHPRHHQKAGRLYGRSDRIVNNITMAIMNKNQDLYGSEDRIVNAGLSRNRISEPVEGVATVGLARCQQDKTQLNACELELFTFTFSNQCIIHIQCLFISKDLLYLLFGKSTLNFANQDILEVISGKVFQNFIFTSLKNSS